MRQNRWVTALVLPGVLVASLYSGDVSDIEASIARIKAAPASERRVLMNRLKRKIAAMDAKNRQEVLARLAPASAAISGTVPLNEVVSLQQATQINRIQMNETTGMNETVARFAQKSDVYLGMTVNPSVPGSTVSSQTGTQAMQPPAPVMMQPAPTAPVDPAAPTVVQNPDPTSMVSTVSQSASQTELPQTR
ncbi:MAG: hypothetical protein GXO33_01605 [Epsilonproteobacteria bacterium]|nr:hypothetical protein [Campylobacterota bacterium]